jgi:hypothetical protein
MTQSSFENKENIDTARAEVAVLRDRLSRVQRQYDTLVHQKNNADNMAEQNRRMQQLLMENEKLTNLVNNMDISRNEQISNLVRANAELQNKILKLESSSLAVTPPTQLVAQRTVRLFSPAAQKKLLDLFYEIPKPPEEWTKIVDCVIANTGRETILEILNETYPTDSAWSGDFVCALLLVLGKVHDPPLMLLRDKIFEHLPNAKGRIPELTEILTLLPTESLLTRRQIPSIMESFSCHLNTDNLSLLKFLCKCIMHASPQEVSCLHVLPMTHNIFITASGKLRPTSSAMTAEEDTMDLRMKCECVELILAGVLKTQDVVALLNLREDWSDSKTIGQRIFYLFFNELLRESRIRHHPIPESDYRKYLPLRTKIIRGCLMCLARLGAVWTEASIPVSESPIKEGSLLIASVFGLVKDLSIHRTPLSSPIDEIVCNRTDSLLFLKELCDTVPGLEHEVSAWTVQ